MKFIKSLLQIEADPELDGGGGIEPKATPAAAAPAESDPSAEDDGLDEFGYAKPTEGTPDKKGEAGKKPEVPAKKKPDSKKVEEEEATPEGILGYGADDEEEEEETPPAKPPAEDEIKLDYELGDEAKKLPKEELTKLKKFAKEHGMNEKQAKAYVSLRTQEIAQEQVAEEQAEKEFQAAVKAQRREWTKELQDDPNFGKEKYSHNVKLVEKVVTEHLPNFKKVLTEKGTMLPPYLMRDLAALGKQLYSTPKLTTGEPPAPPKQEEDPDSHLDFYTSGE